VRRIRALAAEVRRSAASRYSEPVRADGDDELAELARAFNQAGEEVRSHLLTLEQREQVLRAFVANTTHDVMVPLTVLQGHLVSLRKSADRQGTTAELLVSALEETHYLASLVHNLGAAAKLEAGEPEMARSEVDLCKLVERVAGRHRPIARERAVQVELAVPEDPLCVEGDVTLIEQALSNIVHNAVRYNHPEGHVAIVLDAHDGARRFSLRVIDDGPGVPEDQLSRLSERHFRGDAARTRRPEGRGLGLHITRQVAERHGFDLRFRRAEGGGLEVELSGSANRTL
jgi:signal transduction histidine kinase